jgi:hypothetical protein
MYPRRIAGVSALLVVFVLPACDEGPPRATVKTFVGFWSGHTRRLEITPDGRGREVIDSGCCRRAVTARFRLLHVTGTPTNAAATIRFTSARVDRSVFRELRRRPPHAGQVGTLRLLKGAINRVAPHAAAR